MHWPYLDEESPAIVSVQDADQEAGGQPAMAHLPRLLVAAPPPPAADHEREDEECSEDTHSEHSWELLSHDVDSPRSHSHHADAAAAAYQTAAAPAAAQQPPAAAQQPLAEEAAGEIGEEEQPGSPHSIADSYAESDATANKLYSLSQEGSIDALSDSETCLTDDLMAQGEPDHQPGSYAASDTGSEEGSQEGGDTAEHMLQRLAATVCEELVGLSARVAAHVEAGRLLATDVGSQVWGMVTEWVQTVQEKLVVAAFPMLQLASDELAEAGQHVRLAVARVLKAAPHKRVDWAKVALSAGCVALAALLYRSNATNRRLAGMVAQRDAELADVVERILALRNRTSTLPLIRPTACTMAASWGHLMHAV